MSIASEITALNTNLSAAKTAVTTKGGTVGDTGLAGLADEIATIPTGGSLVNYGSITYLDANNEEQTLTLVNEDDYIELTLGVSDSSNLVINNTSITKNKIISVTLADGVQYIPNSFCAFCTNLTTVVLPSTIHFIGDNVFRSAKITSTLNLDNVKMIGNFFLYGNSNFNQPINLPKIDRIGESFLYFCSNFNQPITLNDDTKYIGENFLTRCSSFAQNFSIPSGLEEPIQRYFLYRCDNFTGVLTCNSSLMPSSNLNDFLSTTSSSASMYTTGITLTGTYASELKTALPDRDTSPYRKLNLGS